MDGKALTIHLKEWSDQEKVVAAEQVKALVESPGWEYVKEGISMYVETHLSNLIPSPQGSIEKYAHTTGQMKGLREVEQIARGIVKAGEEAEARLRSQERVEA